MNARSIVRKVDDFKLLLSHKEYDMIMITESWAADHISDAEISVDGYDLFRNDRKSHRGGGCLIYVKNNLHATLIEDLSFDYDAETLWCKLDAGAYELIICTCYRMPSSSEDEDDKLHECIKVACDRYKNIIITGDFNHPSIKWEELHSRIEGLNFMNLTLECYLTQHVKEATRGQNILDLVLSYPEQLVEEVEIAEPLGTSDHCAVEFKVPVALSEENWKVEYHDYRNANYKGMRGFLRNINWSQELNNLNCEEMWSIIKSKYNLAVGEYVPKRIRSKSKKQPPWWNKKINSLRRKRTKWWKQYQTSKLHDDYIQYKNAMDQTRKEIRNAKRKHENKIACNIKTDPKLYYRYARSKMQVKEGIGPLRDENNVETTDIEEMSTILNNYFATVFTEEDVTNVPTPTIFNVNNEEVDDIDLSPEAVYDKLKSLDPEKAPGNDNINPAILRNAAKELAVPLSIIFKESLSSGEVPEDWRLANVTPIYKKGSKKDACNYRPISLTSQVCKVMEKMVKDNIVEHLNKYNLIKDSQHGFTQGKSCLTNLLTFLEHVTSYIDQGRPVDVLYLDFSKAFDKVPHQRLISKLRSHGIGRTIARWISEWLKDRKQRVTIQGKKSSWLSVTSGVPQGSVLGPTLFIMYINDIDNNITSGLLKFADDTKIYGPVASDEEISIIQQDLNRAFSWSQDWQMLFNASKCKCLHVGHANKRHVYTLGDQEITASSEERDLGVLMTENLSPSHHIAKIVKKANQVVGTIKRTYEDRSMKNLVPLYKTLVRPHLEYCVQAWRPYLQQDINNIEGVQRRMTKLMRGCEGDEYVHRLKRTKLISLEMRRLRSDLIEVFKIMHNMEGLKAEDFFKMRRNNGLRGHGFTIAKQYSRLNCRKFFFSQRVVEEWNKLPPVAVNAETINGFKNQVDPMFRNHGELYISQRRLPAPVLQTRRDAHI